MVGKTAGIEGCCEGWLDGGMKVEHWTERLEMW